MRAKGSAAAARAVAVHDTDAAAGRVGPRC